jgi:endonuclease/exonuclease/phosphatase family metal-dependent hydrolase
LVLGDGGAAASVRTARGGLVIRPNDFNPERIMLDDGLLPTPPVDVGDRFAGPVIGVVDYTFGNFKLQLTEPLMVVPGGLAREVTAAPAANQLAVATFNVENLDPNDGAAKFDALAGLIVGNLRAPDLIALEEIQDNNGPTNDAVVDAGLTYQTLIAAIGRAGGPAYDYRQIDPVDDRDGGEPGGNIRVGFLFRTDRGLRFVDRPGGGPTTATAVVAGPTGPELSASPGRVAPTDAAFTDSRKPLAGEFAFRGRKLFVVANHFNSKGGDRPLFGRFQPPERPSEIQRHGQARIVHDFVDGILSLDPDASVVVLGDLNDFDFSTTLAILEQGGILVNLMDALPLAERYSYVFEGNSQVLDQVLVSPRLAGQPFAYDVVHVNAEFADQDSDHEPQVARFTFDTQAPTLSASAAPPPNAAGWNNADVTVHLAAADEPEGTGVAEIGYTLAGAQSGQAIVAAASASVTVSAEGTTDLTAVASDRAGNRSPSVSLTLRIDKTAPTVAYSGNAGGYGIDGRVEIRCAASDALSGLAATTCRDVVGPAHAFAPGANTFSATATDLAGNVGTGSVTFAVGVTADGLCRLTERFASKSGVARALCVTLEHGQFRAYANELRAQSGKALSEEHAALLTRLVGALPTE